MSKNKTILSSSFTFEAAHRLVKGYLGKCRHLHGHSFRVTCFIEGEELNQFSMLRDFSDFKIIQNWCDNNWDHATLLAEDDHETIQFLQSTKQKYFIFKDNPTSETIAHFLFQKATELQFPLSAVTIEETCTHACTVKK